MTNKQYIAEIADVYLCGDNLRVWIRTIDRWGSNIRETLPLRYYADASPQVLPRLMRECGIERDWERGLVEDARRLIGRRLIIRVCGGRWYGHFRAAPEIRDPELLGAV